MTSTQPGNTGIEDFFNGWMKTSGNIMNAITRSWTPGTSPLFESTDNAQAEDPAWPWVSTYNTWQKMATHMNNTLNFGSLFMNPIDMMKDIPQMPFTGWPGIDDFSPGGNTEDKETASTIAQYNKEVIDAVMGIYHREFKKFLSIPKLGLTRTYQEKLALAIDKFNLFQTNLTEFINILNIPLKQSYDTARENLLEMTKKKCRPDDMKKYHQRWLKKLESKYHELLNSPEYARVMSDTLGAMAEFTEARQNVLQDVMKIAGVPVEKDMDELYKDMYLLKKRLKKLEKQAAAAESNG